MITQLDHEKMLEESQNRLVRNVGIGYLAIGIIILIIFSLSPNNIWWAPYIALILGTLILILQEYGLDQLAQLTATIAALIMVYIISYSIFSAYMFMIACMICLFTVLSQNKYYLHLVFVMNSTVIALYIYLGIFTFEQTLINNIATTNNVQVLLYLHLATYLIAVVLQNTIIKTIEVQRDQYDALLKIQNLMLSQTQQESSRLLLSGVSHDFKNALTIIAGNIELMKYDAQKEGQNNLVRSTIDEMKITSKKASDLSKNLFNLMKTMEPSDEPIIYKVLIEEIAELALYGSNSTIAFDLCDEEIVLQNNGSEISQIVQNVILFMEKLVNYNGKLGIRVEKVFLENNNPFSLPQGNYSRTDIFSNVAKLGEEEREYLFELPVGKSDYSLINIGLSISRSLVLRNGGYIDYAYKPQQGSIIFFLLPVV